MGEVCARQLAHVIRLWQFGLNDPAKTA